MSNTKLNALIQELTQAFTPFYREAMQTYLAEVGIQGRDWFNTFLAQGIDPEPISATFFHSLFPYGNIENSRRSLAQTAEHGFFEAVNKDTYQLTDKGRSAIAGFFKVTAAALAEIEPLPKADMERLADLLNRIVDATADAPEPADKPQFNISRRTDPRHDAAASVRIDQYVTDLLRYRDDAHLAAWSQYGVSGHAWETFSLIWSGEVETLADATERLQGRGHEEETYVTALHDLIERNWLTEDNGKFQITETGQKVREEAETHTDQYFYTGWSALSEDEAADLEQGLSHLRDVLQETTASQAIATHSNTLKVANDISGHLFTLTRSAMKPLIEELDLTQRGLFFTILLTKSFEPESVSAELIRRRFPYSSAQNWDNFMKTLAEKGMFIVNGNGTYNLSDSGHDAYSRLTHAFFQRLSETESSTSSSAELERLADLLGRVVNACLNASEPPGTWSIRHNHNLAPDADADAPFLARIDQHLDDLNAFRDDAHLASFKSHDISGHGWELFTFLWNSTVKNADEMLEKASFRGHSSEDYEEALSNLVGRGWVESADENSYKLTDTGKQIREKAESLTDRYFYLPWANALNIAQSDELRDLITSLETSLKQLAEAGVVPA